MTQKKLVLQDVQVMATPSPQPRLHPQSVAVWHASFVWFGVKSCLFTGGFVGSQVFSIETQGEKNNK